MSPFGQRTDYKGVYTSVELKYALTFGYQIVDVHEVWHYQAAGRQLFDEFITKFIKIKVQNSGWPIHCKTMVDRRAYLDELKQRDGIVLTESEIADNPAMRSLGKMLVNVLWYVIFLFCLSET